MAAALVGISIAARMRQSIGTISLKRVMFLKSVSLSLSRSGMFISLVTKACHYTSMFVLHWYVETRKKCLFTSIHSIFFFLLILVTRSSWSFIRIRWW